MKGLVNAGELASPRLEVNTRESEYQGDQEFLLFSAQVGDRLTKRRQLPCTVAGDWVEPN